MAEALHIRQGATKAQIYQEIIPQIASVISGEDNLIANLANISAILDAAFGHLWTGFYITEGDTLVLGPFQGPLACTRIPLKPKARGVCGAAAEQQKTQLVPNVEEFPSHIACSSASRSEIVVPLVANGETKLVLDIDSTHLNSFDDEDAKYCEDIMALIKKQHY